MIATRKISLGFLIAAFFLVSGRAWAATACPASQPVYVSSGPNIECIEAAGTTHTVTVLFTDPDAFTIGDVAFGPDGKLYWTDSSGEVSQFDPKSTVDPKVVATISDTLAGVGFSSSNGDLYVAGNTGVYLIAGIASTNPPTTVTVKKVITFPSPIKAGGLAFDVFSEGEAEQMTIVDQSGTILQSAFPFTSAKSLTSVSKVGPGIFANFCGDTLVARAKTIDRLSFSFDMNGKLVVTESTYVDLGATVNYFEVAADNTIFVATTNDVSSVAPAKDASGVPSCSTTPTVTQLASLSGANGVAVPPTSITITQNFDPADPSQVFNFGSHKLTLTYKQVLKKFSQSFTAVRSRPRDISFDPTVFPNSTVPIHFSPLGGLAVQYVTSDAAAPVAGVDYVKTTSPSGTDNSIQIKSAFSTDDTLVEPGAAHAATDILLTSPTASVLYTGNVTTNFWFADQATGADTGCCSTFLDFIEALTTDVTSSFELKSPTASCVGGVTTFDCNPQFNLDSNVDFGFSTSATVPIIARLSIAKVQVAADGITILIVKTIDVFSKNSNDVGNLFDPKNNTYNWDSRGADVPGAGPGVYLATISTSSPTGFKPQTVFLTLK